MTSFGLYFYVLFLDTQLQRNCREVGITRWPGLNRNTEGMKVKRNSYVNVVRERIEKEESAELNMFEYTSSNQVLSGVEQPIQYEQQLQQQHQQQERQHQQQERQHQQQEQQHDHHQLTVQEKQLQLQQQKQPIKSSKKSSGQSVNTRTVEEKRKRARR